MQNNKLNKTTIYQEGNKTVVQYYNTNIIKFNDDNIELNAGNFKTRSTKDRLNQAAKMFNLNYQVYQENNKWYVAYKKLDKMPFYNSMILIRSL